MSAMRRRAFTLVELLIVVTIIVVLAGMLLVVANLLTKKTKAEHTQAVLQVLEAGIERFGADRGGAGFRPAPHPFLTLSGNRGIPAGPDTDDGGLLVDQRSPLLYGWPARFAGIFAVPQRWVAPDRNLLSPLHYGVFALDHIVEEDQAGDPADNRRLLENVLGHSEAEAELRDLEALREETSAPNIINDTVYAPSGPEPRVGETLWDAPPQMVKAGTGRHDKWKTYSLPGLAIYDAWGSEIIITYGHRSGAFGFVSAGADGVLFLHPGDDGTYTTTVRAGDRPGDIALDGDDERGDADNIVAGYVKD